MRLISVGNQLRGIIGWCATVMFGATSLSGEKYLVIGDSLSREYQFEFTEFDEARNWVEILKAVRPDDFDIGNRRNRDLTFINSSWDLTTYRYNWSLPTYSAAGYRYLLTESGSLNVNRVFQEFIESDFDDVDRVVIFLGGNDIDRIYGEIYRGEDPGNNGVKDLFSDIEAILDYVQNQNDALEIVLVSVPHIGAAPDVKAAHPTDPVRTQRVSDALELLNRQLGKLANENGAAFADIYSMTHGLLDAEALCIGGVPFVNDGNDDGEPGYVWLGGSLAANFHPNSNGQALVAQAIVAAINERFGDGIAPLTDTEILEDVLGIDPAMPFETWAAGFGIPTGSNGPADDPDRDGMASIVEFGLGFHPMKPDAHRLPTPIVEVSGSDSFLVLSYVPRLDDCPFISVTPQFSSDLQSWKAIATSAVTISSDRTNTVRFPLSETGYIRLLVE